MAAPTLSERLMHMLEAIGHIESKIEGLSLSQFRNDRFLQLGIERCLEIISEASRHIPEDTKDRYPNIPWRQVADIGNRIRHAYHAIDAEIIWEIANGELAELKQVLEAVDAASKHEAPPRS